MNQRLIRNFCIIAHIDHGKSTLADRLMELTGTVKPHDMKNQLLDSMDLERERGITIKLAPVRMSYDYQGQNYDLNLIDTPGHVDFSYEVSRSLAACEGAVLVVDATQGVQAQTLANVYLALDADLEIIPVINKIDLPAANVEQVEQEIVELLGCKPEDIIKISAKTGLNVDKVLEAIIKRVPGPIGNEQAPTRALIFDSHFDEYRGVVLYVRVKDGNLKTNDDMKLLALKSEGIALEIGKLNPKMMPTDSIETGEIGYIVTNFRSAKDAKVGDTVTVKRNEASYPLPGYKDIKPFVYAGFFPESNEDYDDLKSAVEKLSLNDSAMRFDLENSPALGFGIRIGCLGLLHLDIVRERLEREYNLNLIVTNPSTNYQVELTSGETIDVTNAADLPDATYIKSISEPWMSGEIVTPKDYVGHVIELIANCRGLDKRIDYIGKRTVIDFEAPMSELLTEFYDQLKSVTSGYGSFNYELIGYRKGNLVRVDFYVAAKKIDPLAVIVDKSSALKMGRLIISRLKETIPKQSFKISLQAAIGGKIIARDDIAQYRKDVTGYLYGGDVSRRKKLLAKQVRGKKRMKKFGKVDIPDEAFATLLSRDK